MVMDLPSGKSPSLDGFNAEFYRFFGPKIENSFFSTIQFFFSNSTMPSSWGKTFVALIPKKEI